VVFFTAALLRIIKLVELPRVVGQRDGELAGGGDDDPGHPGEAAAGGGLVAVERRAGGEDGDGDGEAEGGEGVADVVLEVDEDGVGEEGAEEDAEHPPVEEGELVAALAGVVVVELVGADGGDVGLGAAGADGEDVERDEEDAQLEARRLLRAARVRRAGAALGWLQRRHRHRQRQQAHPLRAREKNNTFKKSRQNLSQSFKKTCN
jgi:hypothetical protein